MHSDLSLIDAFLAPLRGNTARTYRGHMEAWTEWCEAHDVRPAHPTPEQCVAFLEHLTATGKSTATIAARCLCVRGMIARHVELGNLPGPNPWAHVKLPRRSKTSTTRSLTADEQRRLHQWCATNATPGQYALVRLMGVLGLRVSEAVAFNLAALYQEGDRWLYRYQQKGDRERTIELDDRTIDAIQATAEYRTYAASGTAEAEVWLFPSRRAGENDRPHIHPDTATRDVHAACVGAGVPPISSHGFRHAAITRTLEATGDLRVAQELAGHDSITSTVRYDRRAGLQARGVAGVVSAVDGDA